MVYFSLASLWGFVLGTAAVAVGAGLAGQNLQLGGRPALVLAVAALAAVVGGVLASRAYREARS